MGACVSAPAPQCKNNCGRDSAEMCRGYCKQCFESGRINQQPAPLHNGHASAPANGHTEVNHRPAPPAQEAKPEAEVGRPQNQLAPLSAPPPSSHAVCAPGGPAILSPPQPEAPGLGSAPPPQQPHYQQQLAGPPGYGSSPPPPAYSGYPEGQAHLVAPPASSPPVYSPHAYGSNGQQPVHFQPAPMSGPSAPIMKVQPPVVQQRQPQQQLQPYQPYQYGSPSPHPYGSAPQPSPMHHSPTPSPQASGLPQGNVCCPQCRTALYLPPGQFQARCPTCQCPFTMPGAPQQPSGRLVYGAPSGSYGGGYTTHYGGMNGMGMGMGGIGAGGLAMGVGAGLLGGALLGSLL